MSSFSLLHADGKATASEPFGECKGLAGVEFYAETPVVRPSEPSSSSSLVTCSASNHSPSFGVTGAETSTHNGLNPGAVMAQIHRSKTCLRIFGEDLIPEEITQVLRCVPTAAQRTGQVICHPSGRQRVVKCGNWRLDAEPAEPEDINGQVRWLFSQVEPAPDVWKSLAHQFDVDIFCGLFMRGSNEGTSLEPDVMALLGERGIHLALDIYGADDDEDENVTPPET
jgi:hypothetical protein